MTKTLPYVFLVRDSGIGIARDKLDKIFEPFTQADSSITRKFGGTGLGLAISRQFVELMGGNVGVESVEGSGATFWFTVKMTKQTGMCDTKISVTNLQEPGIAKTPKRPNGFGLRLLLVDDDQTSQLVTKSILVRNGYRVDVADSGQAALIQLEENDYFLVLMDCMMPELSGYETVGIIRDHASKVRNHSIPVIALTANAMREDRDYCIAAGMDDYLAKPLDVTVLLLLLEKWAGLAACLNSADKIERDTAAGSVKRVRNSTQDIFDRNGFLKRNMDDLTLSCEVAALFFDCAPEYIAKIRKAISEKETAVIHQYSHKLKGAADSLSLPLLSETAHKIEVCAKEGVLDKMVELITELECRLEKAVTVVKEQLYLP